MRRTVQVQGLRLVKFEEVYGRAHRSGLSLAEGIVKLTDRRLFRQFSV